MPKQREIWERRVGRGLSSPAFAQHVSNLSILIARDRDKDASSRYELVFFFSHWVTSFFLGWRSTIQLEQYPEDCVLLREVMQLLREGSISCNEECHHFEIIIRRPHSCPNSASLERLSSRLSRRPRLLSCSFVPFIGTCACTWWGPTCRVRFRARNRSYFKTATCRPRGFSTIHFA